MPYSRVVRFSNRILACWKWCLSFRKIEWELEDYPVGTTLQDCDPAFRSLRFSQHRYRAYIVNWAVVGTGDTPQQARADLKQNFENVRQNRKQEGKAAIRPGTNVPVEFASQEKVLAYGELSDDFVQRVLGYEWAWISDESSLWDFHAEETNDLLHAKIREIYGVDVTDIESAKLWMIFERIKISRVCIRQD